MRQYAGRGQIRAQKLGQAWMFDRQDVEAFQRRPAGRPKKRRERR
jgi:hypothetical protein